jgi:hypothetical protein
LAETWPANRKKILDRVNTSYSKAPEFARVYPIVEKCILFEDSNLFNFILNSLLILGKYLGLQTSFITSSSIPIDHTLKAEQKVIAICKASNADTYINPIGGVKLYEKEAFKQKSIDLQFIRSNDVLYKQFDNDFVPCLSIIDVMMFNSKEDIVKILNNYTLI